MPSDRAKIEMNPAGACNTRRPTMKTATLSLLAATAVFAGTSVYLAIELGKTRDALAAEVAARAAQPAQGLPQGVNDPVDLEADTFAADSPDLHATAVAPSPRPGDVPAVSRPSTGRNGERARGDFSSASAQRQRRLSQETRLRQQFSGMPGELGLDRSQADKLFDLLADAQVAVANSRRAYADDPLGARAVDDAARQQRDAAIDALLGPDKAAEFLSFEKTIGARMQVGRIDAQMTAADIPLRDDQRKAMIVELAAEQAERPMPQRDPAMSDADNQTRFLDWQAEYSKRVQQRIEPLLSADQLARYREAVEVQDARRAAQRARAEARRNSQPQNP